jgi:hydroxyacylglutathione hydrolase
MKDGACTPSDTPMRPFTLTPIPAFNDNYLWLLDDGQDALVVDPGDAAPVQAVLAARQLRLAGILVTHHHGDHTGGVAQLRDLTGAPVWGPARERIPQPFTPLGATSSVQEQVQVLGLSWQVLDVPGHTAGHIAYFCANVNGKPLLFCGDTLFSGGCGRLFEGTAEQMLASLDQLAALPGDTQVCAAHEYTLSNLKFALAVEPENATLIEYQAHCQALRAAGQPTLPSSIAVERAINPFLRAREATAAHTVQAHAGLGSDADPVTVFAAMREWKNQF